MAYRRRTKRKGMFLGGLFGGSNPQTASSVGTSSSSQTQVDPGGKYYPLQQQVLQGASDLINRPYQGYDSSKLFGPVNQDLQNAYQGVRNAQGVWQGAFNQAGSSFNAATAGAPGVGQAGQPAFGNAMAGQGGVGTASPLVNQASGSWTDPGTADKWTSPYLQNVVQNTANEATKQFTQAGGPLEQLTNQFTGGSGASFGRDRHQDAAGNLVRSFGQGLSNTIGNLENQGYQQAQTAFGNEQSRLGQLGLGMGQLGVGDIGAWGNLGSNMTNAANTGNQALINAGNAQMAFGTGQSTNSLRDAQALGNVGMQQQQRTDAQNQFDYQQFLQQQNWGPQQLQLAQSLAQGWQLPTSSMTNSGNYSNATSFGGQGSVAGNVLGGLTSLAGMPLGNSTVGGQVGNWLGLGGSGGAGSDGTYASGNAAAQAAVNQYGPVQVARGGPVSAFAAGGYAPVVSALRKTAMRRQPAMQARQQAMQQQGGGGPPGPMAGAPQAFARGGKAKAKAKRAFAKGGGATSDAEADTSSNLSSWYEKRAARRDENRKQRAFESRLRNGEIQAEAESDPGAYWTDLAKQVPAGIASFGQLAGIPGTARDALHMNSPAFVRATQSLPFVGPAVSAMQGLPTTGDIEGKIYSAFGDPQTQGGAAGRAFGETLPNLVGIGGTTALRKTPGMLRRLISEIGDTMNLGTAFGTE